MLNNRPKKSNKNKGFTLIELLVVVLLIGVLSGILIGVINPQGIRKKARDAQRKSDLKKVQAALELYFSDNRTYPVAANWLTITNSDTVSNLLKPAYLNVVPTDPSYTSAVNDPCTTQTPLRYRYNYKSDGGYYYLTALMEISTSDDESKCTTLTNWSTNGCTGGTTNDPDVCYGVQNP